MKGPAGVLALVLAETVGGAAAFLFLTPLWGEVRRGVFQLFGFCILALADRKLTRAPINRFALALIVAVVLEAAAVLVGGFGPARSKDFSALLTAAGLAPWIALGMVGTTALIAGMIKATLRGERATAVQS